MGDDAQKLAEAEDGQRPGYFAFGNLGEEGRGEGMMVVFRAVSGDENVGVDRDQDFSLMKS